MKLAVRKLTTPIALSAAHGVIMNARGSNLWKAKGSTIVKQGYTSIYHYRGGGKTDRYTLRAFGSCQQDHNTVTSMIETGRQSYFGFLGDYTHDPAEDTFSIVVLNVDSPTGETYQVTLTRDQITISGYSDDSILANCEAWADGFNMTVRLHDPAFLPSSRSGTQLRVSPPLTRVGVGAGTGNPCRRASSPRARRRD